MSSSNNSAGGGDPAKKHDETSGGEATSRVTHLGDANSGLKPLGESRAPSFAELNSGTLKPKGGPSRAGSSLNIAGTITDEAPSGPQQPQQATSTGSQDVQTSQAGASAATNNPAGAAPSQQQQPKRAQLNLMGLQFGDENPEDDEQFSELFSIEESPAFKALEALKGNKHMPEAKIKEMKERMHSLHQYLLIFHDHEKSLQKKTKQLVQEVSNQRMEIDKAESKAFSNNSEIGDLRRELHKSENEVRLAMEREDRLAKNIEDATGQKNELENDIEEIRKHKADLLEPVLIANIKELKNEIAQRMHQLDNLDKDLEEKEATYEVVYNENEKLDAEREKHSAALARSSEMPQKILKQSEVLRDAISSLVIENVKQSTLSQQFDNEIEKLAKRKRELAELKLDQAAEYEQHRSVNNTMEAECDDIFKQHEFAKDQLSAQLAERVRLELAIKNLNATMRMEHDILLRAIREKESQLKHHRRLQTVLNNVSMSTPQIKQQLSESTKRLEMLEREDKIQRKKMTELKKEIDFDLFNFLRTEGEEKTEGEKMTAQKELNRKMELELEEIIEKRTELARQIDALKGERELKSRDLIRIQTKHKAIMLDKMTKDMAIADASKRCAESVNRLKEFTQLYDVVKNERNKYLNQIQATSQRAAEMKEKIKILANEIEILRHEIMNKDRELTRKRQENTAAYALRDAAKNDANKLLATYRERREQIDQHLSRIETLNVLINNAEEEMTSVKERYERAVKERNSVGVHLLDRNDELCILYERLNVQAGVAQKGEEALIEREEDSRRLKIVQANLERMLELGKSKLPEAFKIREECKQLEVELEECRKRVAQLSEKIESSEDASRCRDLGGNDPDQKELLEKIRKVELQLAEKEERLLEKDLILEEVTTLTARLKKQTLEGRAESQEVASKLNDLSRKIKNSTRSVMARVSELAMYQAMAMSLYQEKCEKEALVEEAKHRLERGEMPTEEIEKEFIRVERARIVKENEIMALHEKQERQMTSGYVEVDNDNFYVYNNIRTMAEPRPNAYLPTSVAGLGDLPVPRPYGAHAPFKPPESGNHMRFMKKPVVKPVEI